MRLLSVCLALALLVFSGAVIGGCASVRVRSGPLEAASAPPVRVAMHTVLFGFARLSNPVDLQTLCPQGWQRVETRINMTGMIFRIVTAGLYSPWEVVLTCRQSS